MAPMHNRTVTSGPVNQSSGLLAAVLEGAGVGIVVLDTLGHIVTVNTAFCDLLGYAKEELLGLHERNLTDDDSDAALFHEIGRAHVCTPVTDQPRMPSSA